MRTLILTLPASLLFLAGAQCLAQEQGPIDPFFVPDAAADVTLTAPFDIITRDRSDEEEFAGKFQHGEKEYDVQVRARGRFRRQKEVCDFPPIRLNFKKSQTRGTDLHGVDKVKLVTHCKDRSPKYEQTILREYVAYKILNILTPASFQVRLLRITYIDSDGKQPQRETFGIIIEHRDRLGKRLGRPRVEIGRANIEMLDPAYTNLVSVYQYLIGNTDFSPIAAAKGELCCHNAVLFGNENEPYLSIPYDFDQAGIVNAPHAGPNPKFGLRNVKQRLYRGRCRNNGHLDATTAYFVEKRAEILEMIGNVEGASSNTKRGTVSYVERFYKIAENPKSVQKSMAKPCLESPGS
jgi:hypothetical protein